MKKTIALSAVLVLGSLGAACGGGANSNVVNTANSANGNRLTNIASNANQMAANANQTAMNANMRAENAAINSNMTNANMMNGNMANGNRSVNANK